jgi:putative cell wall-binding protein
MESLCSDSLEAPTVSDLKYTSSDKTVTFELGKATPEGEKLGYIITDGKDYSTADAISSYELSKATALSTKGRTLTVTSSLTLSSPTVYVYVFYYKEAAKDKTVEVSSLTRVTGTTTSTPTSNDISFASSIASPKEYGTAISTTEFANYASLSAATAKGVSVTKDAGTLTGTYVIKSGSTDKISLPAVLDVGSYDYYGKIAASASFDGKTQYDAATDLKFGSFTVKPYSIDTTNAGTVISKFTFANAVAQYTASPLTYDSVPLTIATPVAKDKVNATGVTVTVDTSTSGTPAPTKIKFTGVSNSNYTVLNPITLDSTNASSTLTASKVTVVEAKLSSVDVYKQPTNNTIVKTNASYAFDGIQFVANYAGGGKRYLNGISGSGSLADLGTVSYSPDLNTILATTGAKSVIFSVNVSGTKYTCTTAVPVDVVLSAVAATKITLSPATATVKKGDTIDAPTLTYRPTNTTAKDFKLSWAKDTSSANTTNTGAIKFYDVQGIEIPSTTGAALSASDSAKVAKIEGTEAGIVILTATCGALTSKMTITISDVAGSISYKRVSGGSTGDRYDTAAAIAKEAFPSGADTVVLVTGKDFPDALSASGLAGSKHCPVLMTASDKLSTATASLIKDWGVKTVYIIGGTSAISTDVEKNLTSTYGITDIERYYGADRVATAEDVYNRGGFPASAGLIIATSQKAADALSISPWAYSMGMPILLAQADGTLSDASMKIAMRVTGTIYILGKEAAVKASVENSLNTNGKAADVIRLGGDTRYETSVAIAKEFVTSAAKYNYTVFASGADAHYPDALVGGMLAGKTGSTKVNVSPIVLVDGTSGAGFDLASKTLSLSTNAASIKRIYFLGGESALTPTTMNAILNNWTSSTIGTWSIN